MSSKSQLIGQIATEFHNVEQIKEKKVGLYRQTLPTPNSSDLNRLDDNFVAPRTPTERKVAQIWVELLECEQVGIYNDLFELGGDSLLALRIMSRVHEVFQIEIPLDEQFADVLATGTFTVAEIVKIVEQYQIEQADPDEIAAMLEKLDGLSDEEIKALLLEE
jgi:acyl carrier protein